MKSITYYLALLLTLLAHSSSQGAELMLRERATQQGTIVRLGDIADISTASSTEMRILTSTPLLPAPAPGTQQFLSVAQVRELLVARGLQMDQLTIKGARIVEIGSVAKSTTKMLTTKMPTTKTDAEPTTPQLTFQAAELRVQQAIEQHLHNNTSERDTSAGRWRVEVTLTQNQIDKIAGLAKNFEARGQRPIRLGKGRSGKQRFFLSDGGDSKDILVTATITQIQSVVVVRQRIEREQLVRAVDVEILEREGNLPGGSLTDLEQVVGKVAQRSLRPDDIMQKNHVRAAWQVRRGETVSVFVRTGGIVVRTRAIAKENGAMGDLISVEMLEGKKRLTVSVSGPGEVAVHATGGRATDYASLRRDERRRR